MEHIEAYLPLLCSRRQSILSPLCQPVRPYVCPYVRPYVRLTEFACHGHNTKSKRYQQEHFFKVYIYNLEEVQCVTQFNFGVTAFTFI